MSRIYVASSWRNAAQPNVVDTLRYRGHEVYDFRNPPNGAGFGWEEVMPSFGGPHSQLVKPNDYLAALDHPRAIDGFLADFDAMRWADVGVCVLPCGRSAHDEIGWMAGAGKATAILLDRPLVTPELMYLMHDLVAANLVELVEWLEAGCPRRCGPSAALTALSDVKPSSVSVGTPRAD